ncbi:hypothetical protein ACS0TY_033416 [Phlomoides rotata]
MNPNYVGPSQTNFSSSEEENSYRVSSDDEYSEEENLLAQQIYTNNLILTEVLRAQGVHPTHGGSVPGHKIVKRDREAAAQRLFNDYFSENPANDEVKFRRRFLMSRSLFLRISNAVKDHDNFFVQRRDAANRLGLSTLQKITTALRVLAYGMPADVLDDYLKIGESTTNECMKRFCRAIVEIFGAYYLRLPTANDIARLLHVGRQRGFPGMLGSLDCMHWQWKNCPTGWAGQYAGRSGSPNIILEVVADYDLWIWHAYFGMPGANNDINVLDRSPLFSDLTRGIAPPAHYVIQGKEYNMGYYLADNIYPKWSTLVQTIREPRSNKHRYFASKQESCRKDVERALGVLQSRFHILANPVRFWSKDDLRDIITACIIMHNMIIEDERDLEAPIEATPRVPAPDILTPQVPATPRDNENSSFKAYVARYKKIRDKDAHITLRNALIDHLWEGFSNSDM